MTQVASVHVQVPVYAARTRAVKQKFATKHRRTTKYLPSYLLSDRTRKSGSPGSLRLMI
jgi:hypothetical protein